MKTGSLSRQKDNETQLSKNVSVGEIAKVLKISDRYLYNLFIKYKGIAPKKYLGELRLKCATEMLAVDSFSITEIALSVGFSDGLTFSRFFQER